MELSGLGMGTYLGEVDAAKDADYAESAQVFFQAGGTVFDTAANYRCGRSERALGQVFKKLPREAYFISTKAGYLPMGDGLTQETPRAWFQRVLTGVVDTHDIVDGCHAMTPRYLSHQLDVSRKALGVDTVDLFHLHNPEQQRPALGPEGFHRALRAAFEACEGFVQEGRIRAYGCATWNGFRVLPDHPARLCLEELLGLAEEVGGSGHHFRWIQLPLNLAMPEAFLQPTQRFGGREMPILEAAHLADIQVQTSASLMQGRILATLPRTVIESFGCRTAAQAALQFTRSCPGVTVALAGMSHPAHVRENLTVLALPKLTGEVLKGLYS
mgnify:CR=1 FL=1